MKAADRLVAGAARRGIVVGAEEAEGLALLVERVEVALREPTDADAAVAPGVAVAPDVAVAPGMGGGSAVGASPSGPDDGAWVWRADSEGGSDGGDVGGDGALRGWRVGVKDLVAVAGHPLRCGSAATFDAPLEPADADVVALLRRAGAVVVGATKLHEFAFGTTGVNAVFGTPANPVAAGRVPGGSSSGSGAAVAAGEADLAVGTDTGGSVRIPAALCGVVGFKPSLGAISTSGVVALSPTLDHVGYLVRDVERLAASAQALGLAALSDDRPGVLRLGIAAGATDVCDPEVATRWGEAISALAARPGIDIVEVDWPGGEAVFAATTAIMFAEAAHVHAARLSARHSLYGADVRARLVQGSALDLGTYLRARDVRRLLRRRCLAVLADVAAVVTPTVPVVAPRLEDVADPAVGARLVTFTRLADLTGLPAVSVPLPGVELPIGLQVEAADDATAITVARTVGRRLAA